MSKFSKNCDAHVKIGLNFSAQEWGNTSVTRAEQSIGKFDSGYIETKHSRRIDRRIFSGFMYGISRGVDIEYMGSQHFKKKFFTNRYGKIEGIKRFKDQVMRDRWQATKAEEANQICVWIIEPSTYNGVNDHEVYDTQCSALYEKLASKGYLYKLLYECERSNAKGVVIYWDHHSTIITKSFPTVKI